SLQAQPIGLDSSVRDRPSSSADCVMEDLVDGTDGFLLDQSDLLEVDQLATSFGGFDQSLKVASGADQNRPAKGP
ncbi:hypothetical protein LINPERHAP1_LOCUS6084, partial [Linum perenne]